MITEKFSVLGQTGRFSNKSFRLIRFYSYMEDMLLWSVHQPYPSKNLYRWTICKNKYVLTGWPVFADTYCRITRTVHFLEITAITAIIVRIYNMNLCAYSFQCWGSYRWKDVDHVYQTRKMAAFGQHRELAVKRYLHEKLIIPNEKKKEMCTDTQKKSTSDIDNGMCFMLWSTAGIPKTN